MVDLLGEAARELTSSRAYWLLLLMIGPLVAHAFMTATATYAEMSGAGGGPAALAQGLSPLDGIVVPTFGAYDIAITLLFPFVVIRLVAGERQSGALKLLAQSPARTSSLLWTKVAVLVAGWIVAWIPGFAALLLWRAQGGHLFAPETLNVLLGQLLLVLLTTGVAMAAAAVAEHASSAAIMTLGFTIGTWALEFMGQVKGGFVERLAAFTPAAAQTVFEHGELRVSTIAVLLILALGGVLAAAVWLAFGTTLRARLLQTAIVLGATAIASVAASTLRRSADVSEDRRNSFSEADEAALAGIHDPLAVRIHLAPEDPRLADLEREVLRKLRRALPKFDVSYVFHGRTGMFASDSLYGQMTWTLGDRSVTTRSSTEAIVLEVIYQLAAVPAPNRAGEPAYRGYPHKDIPRGAGVLLLGVWPVLVAGAWWRRTRLRAPVSVIARKA
jgi:ABC-2 type transport system permease protein